jgi:hypothetical protein
MSSQSQRRTCASTTLIEGELRHAAPFWLMAEATASAQTATGRGVGLKRPK